MSLIQVPKGVWTKLTTTDKDGEVFHKNGTSPVAYVEAAVIPVGFDADTPVSGITDLQESLTYYRIDAANFLWAFCRNSDAILTVTPVGV